YDILQLCFAQFRKDRQRERLCGGLLGVRKIPGLASKVGKARLQVQRYRIVDLRADAVLGQELPQRLALAHPDHVLVVDVARTRERMRSLKRHTQSRRGEGRVIVGGVTLPGRAPVIQMPQLDVEYRGL